MWWQAQLYRNRALRYVPHSRQQAVYVGWVARLARLHPEVSSPTAMLNASAAARAVIRDLAWLIAEWPLPRLQVVRGQLVEFLFPVPESWRGLDNHPLPRGRFKIGPDGLPTIRLFPSVVGLLSRLGSLLRPAVELECVRHVTDMNSLQPTPEENLRHTCSLMLKEGVYPRLFEPDSGAYRATGASGAWSAFATPDYWTT